MASFSYQTPDLASVLATLAAHTHPPHLNPAALSSSSPFTPTPAAPQKSQDLEEGEYEPAEHISAGLDPAESFSRIPPLRSGIFPLLLSWRLPCVFFLHYHRPHSSTSSPLPAVDSSAPLPHSRHPSLWILHSLPYICISDPRIKSHTSTSHPPLSKPSPRPPTPSPAKITTWPPALRHVTKMLVPNPEFTRRVAHLIHAQHKHERQWWSGREALVQKLESREEGRRKLNDVL